MGIEIMTKIPNFADVPLRNGNSSQASLSDWQAAAAGPSERLTWQTPEQIPVRPLYTAADLDDVRHLDTMPGFPPFVRGRNSNGFQDAPQAEEAGVKASV